MEMGWSHEIRLVGRGCKQRFQLDFRGVALYNSIAAGAFPGEGIMAKVELRLTPERLLDEIRAGSLKDEIIRTYRTNDAELAMMLLPMHRSGQIVKEEFNDFFKGVSLKKDSTPRSVQSRAEQVAEVPVPEKDRDQAAAPSRISLSGLFSLRSRGKAAEKPGEIEKTEPHGVPAHAEAVSPSDTSRELSIEEAFGTTADGGPLVSIPGLELHDEVIQAPASEAAVKDTHPLLEKILTRLNVIEKRLAGIEQKLGNP